MPGLLQHLLLTLRLNFRSKQPLIYGYLVPVFFLFAFATLFRGDMPRLLPRMGQLLTVSTLGGACFGMPTAMVAERERGVWRRYRLLPSALGGLVASTMVARYVLVASAALLQIALAWLVYRTPMPRHPLQLALAFTVVAFSFEGMGLVIAALADTVPAVQALGQAIFLPMIMVGGVGVPLSALPTWARQLAGFLPGRYAVEALQPCFTNNGLNGAAFSLVALLVIGVAGVIAGARMFRWDAGPRQGGGQAWLLLAAASWVSVGLVAMAAGRSARLPPGIRPTTMASSPWDAVTEAQIDAITFGNLPDDAGTIAPVAASAQDLPVPEEQQRLNEIRVKLDAWPPAHVGDDAQRVRNLLSAAMVADVTEDPMEGAIARLVFDRLQADFDHDELVHILAWIILDPEAGTVVNRAPELDLTGQVNPDVARDRVGIYARKLLGRLLGKVPDVTPS